MVHATVQEYWEKQVLKNNMSLAFIPKEYLSMHLCEEAVKLDPHAIRHIPQKYFKDEYFCSKIILYAPELLETIPQNFLTEKVCMSVVVANSELLGKLPMEKRTLNVCECAIEYETVLWDGEHGYSSVLRYVPETLRNQSLCMRAVRTWYEALEFVPEHVLTDAMCITGLMQSPLAITYIPKRRRTDVMISMAKIPECNTTYSLI